MIVSVTVLGDATGLGPGSVAGAVIRYLEGGRTVAPKIAKGGRQPGSVIELPNPEGGTVAYYADSAGLRPGRWVLGRDGDIDPSTFAVALAGYDPESGEQLLSGSGRAGQATHARTAYLEVDSRAEWFTAARWPSSSA